MLSKKQERTFGNGRLRDQWEKRAQSEADQCKQEAEFKKKSSLKLLFSKWNYHLTTYTNGDQVSDFRRVTSGEDEADKNKPKIKFKVVPPPPKPKPEPPPPPPPSRRRSSPRPHRQKRKVEVDVFRLCWKDSWMSTKPPKYLFLKAKELKARILEFTTIEIRNRRTYKPKLDRSEDEVTPAAEAWKRSWKQVKSPAQSEFSELKQKFEWEILFERELLCEPEVEKYSLPVWAGTWKIMNFVFRQQKQSWDCVWPEFQQSLSNTSDKLQELEDEDELTDWDESWKLSGADFQAKDGETLSSISTVEAGIVDFCQPGWSNSWLLSAAPPDEEEERQKSWTSCWRFRQQIRWRRGSLQSHHHHSDTMMRRRRTVNVLLSSPLDDDVMDSVVWTKAWKTPKELSQPEEGEEFHKLHASFSSWSRSWMVAVAHRGGDLSDSEEPEGEEQAEWWWAWKESWKICRWKKPEEDDVTCFSAEHLSQRHAGLMREDDGCEGEGCRGRQSALSSSSVVKSKSSQDFLGQLAQVNSPNPGERKHRDAGGVLPFIGLTGSSEQSRSCCKNGGTCILGSFCACPPFFSGRSCEYNQHVRNCGSIPHGVWVRKGCSYCRCGYGVLHCFPNVFHKDCDESEDVTWSHSSAVRTVLNTCVLCGTLLLLLVL
uniref:teratocarcinoma-derived growth factor 1 n=1 Tax=Solea senegalensis TaxID=28829 RepID=UPI001CD88C5D|nr:teratocarcinoma-derived growth factor 1 [Solea senegalensis]